MLRVLSKSFLISVCTAALVIGLVFQIFGGHSGSQLTANGGSEGQPSGISPQTGTEARTLTGTSNWIAAVRLESGEIIPLYIILQAYDGHVSAISSGSYPGGYIEMSTKGLGAGKYDNANSFDFTLEYTYRSPTIGYEEDGRSDTQIHFDGKVTGDTAEGTVIFTDEYRNKLKGTFAFVRVRRGVTIPTPKDPGGSGTSVINGKWQGQFIGEYHLNRIPLNLELHQQQTVISGTATMDNKPVEVTGNVAGSSFNLRINNSIPYLIISGKVTQDSMKSVAEIFTEQQQGLEHPRPSDYGKAEFTR